MSHSYFMANLGYIWGILILKFTYSPLHLWPESRMLGTPHLWDPAAKFTTTSFSPGSPWAAFLCSICCHWSSAIYRIPPWRVLGNRCGLEFDKNVTSTHPFTLCGILTLEMQGQLGKQPTSSVPVLKFLKAPRMQLIRDLFSLQEHRGMWPWPLLALTNYLNFYFCCLCFPCKHYLNAWDMPD